MIEDRNTDLEDTLVQVLCIPHILGFVNFIDCISDLQPEDFSPLRFWKKKKSSYPVSVPLVSVELRK